MSKYTITITREFGSLGRPIAHALSQKLGIEYYDRDIVDEVAKQLNLPVSQISDAEESSHNHFFSHMFPLGTDKDFLDLARKSSCIIVGRCSDFLLQNEENVVNIFIYAPYKARLENCIHSLEMSEDEAKRMIMKVDKARLAYHKKYAGYTPYDPLHKHLMIDSSLLGIEGTADMIAELIKRKFKDLV